MSNTFAGLLVGEEAVALHQREGGAINLTGQASQLLHLPAFAGVRDGNGSVVARKWEMRGFIHAMSVKQNAPETRQC